MHGVDFENSHGLGFGSVKPHLIWIQVPFHQTHRHREGKVKLPFQFMNVIRPSDWPTLVCNETWDQLSYTGFSTALNMSRSSVK